MVKITVQDKQTGAEAAAEFQEGEMGKVLLAIVAALDSGSSIRVETDDQRRVRY